jgi:hypothetical protein
MAKATAKKQSKYDKVIKLPYSFEQVVGVLANTPKNKTKPRS